MVQTRNPAGEGGASDGSVHAAKLNTSDHTQATATHQVLCGCLSGSGTCSAAPIGKRQVTAIANQYAVGMSSCLRVIYAVRDRPQAHRLKVFENQAFEVAGFVAAGGIDKRAAVDGLAGAADAIGIDPDAAQTALSKAFNNTRAHQRNGGAQLSDAAETPESDDATIKRTIADGLSLGCHAGMTEPCPPSEISLLSQATAYVRPYFDRSVPVGDRLRNLWAAVVAARHLAASDQIENEFMQVAHDAGFETDLGRHADDDLRHVIRWAMLGQNPFQ